MNRKADLRLFLKINKIPLYLLIVFGLFFASPLHAMGRRDSGNELTFYSIRGSSGVGLIRLYEEAVNINGFSLRMETLANADLLAARFISGEARIGILPPNMAAKIASSGRDIRVAAIIGTGMLSLLTVEPSLFSIGDLRGMTVHVAGQGATPDFVFRRILRRHGINPEEDLDLFYALSPPEIAQSLIAGRISTALLPEPFASMARMGNSSIRVISDIQEEWAGISTTYNGLYPMTLLVVDGAFADDYPHILNSLLDEVKNSIAWVTAHPHEAGELVEKHELGISSAVIRNAIPQSSYVFIPANESRLLLEELFNVFLEYDPVSIGGELPSDTFYLY